MRFFIGVMLFLSWSAACFFAGSVFPRTEGEEETPTPVADAPHPQPARTDSSESIGLVFSPQTDSPEARAWVASWEQLRKARTPNHSFDYPTVAELQLTYSNYSLASDVWLSDRSYNHSFAEVQKHMHERLLIETLAKCVAQLSGRTITDDPSFLFKAAMKPAGE